MSIDPLAPDFPQWSPYVFSGNLVLMAKELEGMEPDFMIGRDGKLSKGIVSVMQAAFGYSSNSLTNTTWLKDTDSRTSVIQRALIPEKAVAVTWYSKVAYDHTKSGRSAEWWFGLIAHEQRHDISQDAGNGSGFYKVYAWDGITGGFDSDNMILEQVAYKNEGYALKLWNYNGGEVGEILQRGNITDGQKSQLLQSTGARFRRDVILNDTISNATNLINNATSTINGLGDSPTDQLLKSALGDMISQWQNNIKDAKKEQNDITKKYGQ